MKPLAHVNTPASEEPANLPKIPKRKYEKLAVDAFYYWVKKFRLSDWNLKLVLDEQINGKEIYAQCHYNCIERREIAIHLAPNIESEKELEKTVIHELLHILIWYASCKPHDADWNMPDSIHAEWTIAIL